MTRPFLDDRSATPHHILSAAASIDDRDPCELLTVDEVAAMLRVSRNWVYEHTRARRTPRSECLPFVKIGKYLRFDARAVREFLEKKCRAM